MRTTKEAKTFRQEKEEEKANMPKIKFTKLHVEEIVCIYGYLFGAKVLGVDDIVLLDYNEIHGGHAIGCDQTILVRTEYLEGLTAFNTKEINREGCCVFKEAK